MELLFLYGLPATGKLTVARHLAQRTGYRLFHNHLVVDLLLSTFDFGTAPFIHLREQIWLSVFDQAGRTGLPGLIFTFNPERTVSPAFVDQVVDLVRTHGGRVRFVQLVCAIDELRLRLADASRQQYRKLTSLPLFEDLYARGEFDTTHMPAPELTVDTGGCTPEQAAESILAMLHLY